MTSYYESFSRERDRNRDREWDHDLVYSDDEDVHRTKTTVRRYKVGPDRDHVERIDRSDRTTVKRDSSPSYVYKAEDRRDYGPERSRSAFDVGEVTRRSERERDYYISGHGGRVVYEKTSEIERDRPRDTYTRYSRRGDRDEIVVETGTEDRRDDGRGGEIQRWHKETEYYEPAPQPIVIRNRPPEQKIILQEAPPTPVIVPQAQPGVIVIREHDRHHDAKDKESRREDDYYYERRQRRESGPHGDSRESDMAMERFERRDDRPHRHRHHHHHHHHRYASDGDYSDDGEYYVKKTTIIRRDTSPSTHRKHLAEGALAGAGLGALIGSRRNDQTGELSEHRGRKVLAGAALGALGTEVLKRAHSAYNDRFGDEVDDIIRARSRSRSASHHSKLKTGLGIAAAALAVAGAAKYMQSGRIDREERNRGRSRHRYSDDETSGGYRSRSESRRARSRSHSVAKAAAGTAAVAGLVHHFRSKSRQREGKKRSHSRIRTGAEIAAAGLAGAAAKKIYDKHRDKKELERSREIDPELDDDYYDEYGYDDEDDDDRGRHSARHSTRSASGSRSRSRSARPRSGSARAPYPPSTADADELGLVEYGSQPFYSDSRDRQPAADDHNSYESAADAVDQDDRHPHRRRRSRHGEADTDLYGGDDGNYADVSDNDRNSKRTRSHSRLRNLAVAGAGAAAAAIGIKKYEDKKKREQEAERDDGSVYNDDHDRDRDRARDRDVDRDVDRHRSHDRHHRVTEEELDQYRRHSKHRARDGAGGFVGGFYDSDDSRPPSPPHASGGAYYPPQPPPVGDNPGLMQHANTNINDGYVPYNPLDQSSYAPPPGPPPFQHDRGADVPYPGSAPSGPMPPGPSPPAAPVSGAVYPDTAGPLPSKSEPSYVAPPPQPQAAPDRTRGAGVLNANLGGQPQAQPPAQAQGQVPDVDNHVSATLPSTRDTAAFTAATLPRSSQTSKEAEPVTASSALDGAQDSAPKNVEFAPLSPQSSRTMLRHHAETRQSPAGVSDKSAGNLPVALSSPDTDRDRDHGHGHDPDPDREALILSSQRRRSDRDSRDDDDSDSEIEVLPDRFDSLGRSLSEDHSSSSLPGPGRFPFTSRSGEFEYKSPNRSDGWHVNGQWGIAGTDGVDVDRIASRITGALDSIGSGRRALPVVFGLIGDVLGGISAIDNGSQGRIEDGKDSTPREDTEKQHHHHHYSSDDDRKRKRRNTYDRARSEGGRSRRGGDHRRRSSSPGRITDGYFFDRDGYDGQEMRKRRRSWGS